MKNKWNKQLTKLTIEEFTELSDYYLEHTAKETCDYFNISEVSLRRLCKKFCWTKPKNLVNSKRKESCIKKYGVCTTLCTKTTRDKLAKTLADNKDEIAEKRKATNLEKYGCENVFQADKIKNKIKETNLVHLGVEYPAQNDAVKAKMAATNIELYGKPFFSQTDVWDEKVTTACQQKYGTDYAFQAEEIKEKIRQTNVEKYGAEYPAQVDTVKEKAKQTCLQHFGVEYPLQDALVKEKSKQTCLSNYGVEHYFQDIANVNKSVYKKYFYDNTWFDSLPEFAVYYYFKNNGHNIKRASVRLCYEYDGELHYCFPDFEIDGKLIEIKGDHLYKKMLLPKTVENSKFKCLLANDVKIWVAKDYAFALEYLKQQHIELANYRR